MTVPKLLSKAWASNGLKNDIPADRSDGLPRESATYSEGFPQITMTPIAMGGKAPSGKDMNGVLNELSDHIVYQNKGGIYPFNAEFAEKIGGYPKGAILINDRLNLAFQSLVDNNKTNFNTQNYSGKWVVVFGNDFFVPKTQTATISRAGIVQLSNDDNSDDETKAPTLKAIKKLKGLYDGLRRLLDSYIPNSKKSNAVNSPSSETVATSAAAKTAYDKGVEAKTAADNAQRTADDGVSKANAAQTAANNAQRTANAKQSPATTLAGYGITDFIVKGVPNTTNTRDLNSDGIYAFANGGKNLPINSAFKIINIGGGSESWRHQLAIKAYSTEIYLSSQESVNSSGWLPWRRIDGADWNEVRNRPNSFPPSPHNHSWNQITGIPNTLVHSTSFNASGGVSNYVARDVNGDITARLFRSNFQDEARIQGAIAFRVNNSNDNFTRYCNSPSAVKNWLGLQTSRRDYNRTIKGTNDWDNGKQKDIAISGQVITYPDGRIQQIFHLKHFRMTWFAWEDHNIGYIQGSRGVEIFLQLWSAMPSKIINIQVIGSRSTNANTSASFCNEAGEFVFGWNLRKQGNNKDRIWINTARLAGGQDEFMDLYVVVEGY